MSNPSSEYELYCTNNDCEAYRCGFMATHYWPTSYNPGGDDKRCPECGQDGDDDQPDALCCPRCEQEYPTDGGRYIRECDCRDCCKECGARFPLDELGDPIRPKHGLCYDCFDAGRAEYEADRRQDERCWGDIDRENLA